MRITIKKIAAVPGGIEARLAENHIAGTVQVDGLSLPVEYEIEGELAAPIEVGKSVLVFRDKRNGKKADGIFQSTTVLEVSPQGFRTRNSIYVTGDICGFCNGVGQVSVRDALPDDYDKGTEVCPCCKGKPC